MSLQIKFLLLVGTMLLAVVGSVAAAWWSLRTVHEEVAEPFRSVATVLGELGHLKRQVERTATALGPGNTPDGQPADVRIGRRGVDEPLLDRQATSEDRSEIEAASIIALQRVANLDRNAWYRMRFGLSTWANVRGRLNMALATSAAWASGGSDADRAAAYRACYELHELIENTELRILDDARHAVDYSDQLRTTLAWWLGWVFLAAGLTSVLAVVLLRRWVQRPVADLRQAAARIAAGDFSHRIAVETGDEIGRLMGEVNHMAGMVDHLQRETVERERLAAVGQMVRRIVHNVRNPLSGIRGLAEVTRMDMPAESEGRESMNLIVSTVDTFERWLTDLLETTKPLEVHRRSTPLVPWAQGVIQTHLPGARAKGVQVDLTSDPTITTADIDTRHLDHALAAVIANAIDAAPANSRVKVRIEPTEEARSFEICVQDQGLGVPENLRGRIFEPHFTTKPNGTGIGLALAQQILRAHGGLITLDPASETGTEPSGACFRMRAPIRGASAGESEVADNSHHVG